MRPYGDIPAKDLKLAEELWELENWFNENQDTVPKDKAALGFVSMAHDLYLLEFDEEGDRLITRAEKIYPGYFRAKIHEHTLENSDFAVLVDNLRDTLGLELMKKYGFVYGPVSS